MADLKARCPNCNTLSDENPETTQPCRVCKFGTREAVYVRPAQPDDPEAFVHPTGVTFWAFKEAERLGTVAPKGFESVAPPSDRERLARLEADVAALKAKR